MFNRTRDDLGVGATAQAAVPNVFCVETGLPERGCEATRQVLIDEEAAHEELMDRISSPAMSFAA